MNDADKQSGPPQEEAHDVATLTIVVRARIEGDSTPRVWLLYSYEGTHLTLATSADRPYELIRETDLPTLTDRDAVRIRELDAEARNRFEEATQRFSKVSDAGLQLWTPLRTSEAFAAEIWENTVGEELPHRVFGQSTPETLARSIGIANADDLGLSVARRQPTDLQLSPTDRGLRNDPDDQDQSQRHGHSL